jgi:putative ABC transport system substrate-binding protein
MNRAAPSFGVAVIPKPVHDKDAIEQIIAAVAEEPTSGLVVIPDAFANANRKSFISLAAQHRLPAVYAYRFFAIDGGLVSYGHDPTDPFRQAAAYINRIIRGEHPGSLPIQQPTKIELFINLKTAKALGLTVPPTLLARADEVIE